MAGTHHWRFVRIGGFDQVRLDTAADLLAVRQLDPKLWVALSCPVAGLEFDPDTLRYLDTDQDGHVRVPEVITACEWTGALLKDKELMAQGATALPLAAIDDASDAGRQVLAAARRVLASLGKGEANSISVADTANIQAVFAKTRFNGDGVVTAASADADAAGADAITALVAAYGGVPDRSGETGVDGELVARFASDAATVQEWLAVGTRDPAIRPLGAATDVAAAALAAIEAKLEDWFTRCRLAAYDAGAASALNPTHEAYLAAARGTLSAHSAELEAFPLARVSAEARLDLARGINPAWEARLAAFVSTCVIPTLGARDSLSADEWRTLKARFAPFQAWRAACPVTPIADLDAARLTTLLAQRPALETLIASDLERAAEAAGLDSIDRLVRYTRDLGTLVNNFVTFRDFYTKGRKAVFQAGTLYLDGRSCELAVRVMDGGKHAALAGLSRLCLVYCDCVRSGGAEKLSVAAAFTAGDADQLIVGRNGVFYDRQGRDWDATIVKVIENDISIRQAFWGPYKRVAKAIGEQVRKFAASKAAANEAQLASKAVDGGAQAAAGKPPPAPFDVGKFAGIFAAIGLAVGAIGTALAAIVTGVLSLVWWKIPLVFIGAMLLVSGPAMLLAWLRLRQRNLGPLLDANGWAINARVLINIPFGAALTQVATLPAGSERSLVDPYAEKSSPWPYVLALLVAIALAAATWFLMRGH